MLTAQRGAQRRSLHPRFRGLNRRESQPRAVTGPRRASAFFSKTVRRRRPGPGDVAPGALPQPECLRLRSLASPSRPSVVLAASATAGTGRGPPSSQPQSAATTPPPPQPAQAPQSIIICTSGQVSAICARRTRRRRARAIGQATVPLYYRRDGQERVWVSDGCSGAFAAGPALVLQGGEDAGILERRLSSVRRREGTDLLCLFSYVRYLNQRSIDDTTRTRSATQVGAAARTCSREFFARSAAGSYAEFRYYLYVGRPTPRRASGAGRRRRQSQTSSAASSSSAADHVAALDAKHGRAFLGYTVDCGRSPASSSAAHAPTAWVKGDIGFD